MKFSVGYNCLNMVLNHFTFIVSINLNIFYRYYKFNIPNCIKNPKTKNFRTRIIFLSVRVHIVWYIFKVLNITLLQIQYHTKKKKKNYTHINAFQIIIMNFFVFFFFILKHNYMSQLPLSYTSQGSVTNFAPLKLAIFVSLFTLYFYIICQSHHRSSAFFLFSFKFISIAILNLPSFLFYNMAKSSLFSLIFSTIISSNARR